MAAAVGRIRLSWSLLSGAEQADCSLYFLSASGAALSALTAASDANIDALWTPWKSYMKTTSRLFRVRVDLINVSTGHVISGEDGAIPALPDGTSTGNQLPLQCAEVVTLRTPFSGASFRGRIYLPPMSHDGLDNLGVIHPTAQGLAVGAVADYLSGVNAGSTDWTSAVYSRKNHSLSPVSSVDMGNVFDTQRRRRASLHESRASVPVI